MVRPEFAAILPEPPVLDEIIPFDRRHFGAMWRSGRALRDFFSFLRQLRAYQFDLVLDLQGLFRSGYLSFATRASVRLGFAHAREMAGIFYTHNVYIPNTPEHIVDSCWRFAEALGFSEQAKDFSLRRDAASEQAAARLLNGASLPPDRDYAVILSGGSEAAKRWPLDRWVSLARELNRRYHIGPVLLGSGAEEVAAAKNITQAIDGKEAINLAGRTSLPELTAVIRKATLVVGNDSGPLHIAAALNVPTVGLYGPTNPVVVGPYGQMDGVAEAGQGVPRRGRYSRDRRHQMTEITVDQVLALADKKLANR